MKIVKPGNQMKYIFQDIRDLTGIMVSLCYPVLLVAVGLPLGVIWHSLQLIMEMIIAVAQTIATIGQLLFHGLCNAIRFLKPNTRNLETSQTPTKDSKSRRIPVPGISPNKQPKVMSNEEVLQQTYQKVNHDINRFSKVLNLDEANELFQTFKGFLNGCTKTRCKEFVHEVKTNYGQLLRSSPEQLNPLICRLMNETQTCLKSYLPQAKTRNSEAQKDILRGVKHYIKDCNRGIRALESQDVTDKDAAIYNLLYLYQKWNTVGNAGLTPHSGSDVTDDHDLSTILEGSERSSPNSTPVRSGQGK